MKTCLLTLLLLLASLTAQGRALAAPASPDTVLTPQGALKLLDSDVMDDSYPSLLVPALEALSRSKHKDRMPLWCAKALDHYGWKLIDDGSYYLARELLRKGVAYCPKSDSTTYYSIYSGLAYICLRNHDRANALRLLRMVTAYHRRTRQMDAYALDLYNLGVYHYLTDDRGAARAALDSALSVASRQRLPMIQATTLVKMGEIAGDSQARLASLRQALELEQANNLTVLYASTSLAEAQVYYDDRDYAAALQHARRALEQARAYGPRDMVAKALAMLAEVYGVRGDWQMAYTCQREKAEAGAGAATSSLAMFTENQRAQALVDWCEANVVMKPSGKFELRSDQERASNLTAAIIFALAAAAVIAAIVVLYRRCRRAERSTSPDAQAQIDRLSKLLGQTGREVGYLQLFYNSQPVLLRKIRDGLRQALGKAAIQNAETRELLIYINENMLTDKFSSVLTQRHEAEQQAFIERLTRQHPDLSEGERQLALYLWLGLSTHEICVLTAVKPRTVNMSRYRLRKSLGLEGEQNLEEHIRSI